MKGIRIKGLFLFCLLLASIAYGQDKPAIPEIDRIRIAEAFRVGEKIQNKIWKDWSTAPRAAKRVFEILE